ncbi:MAG: 23S rRNA (guanosine(2251)-2'-O)-methyltransferase RlmB [Nitrospirae bacterium]|nr:23S rRNA (guanosine(2251)-2'-O)-methyltransferase RlmB [Nitrospirota bacterium]
MKTRKTGQAGKSRSREEWVYGLNPVLEVLKSGREVKSVVISVTRQGRIPEIERETSRRGIRLQKADNLFFDSRFPKGHQGIAAAVAPREYADLDSLFSLPSLKGEKPLFLILDCLEDPRNFGAILRVADAAGIHGIVIQAYRSVSLSPEAVKASAGAAEHMPIAMVPNIKNAIREMKDNGLTVIGAEAGTDNSPWDLDLDMPLALVIGSEGRGLRKTVKEDCDILVSIPMRGMVNSLNASVATGVLIFEIMRQRRSNKQNF